MHLITKINSKRGIELVWWTLIVFVLAIVVFLIFLYFIRSGFIHIGSLSGTIFSAPDKFAANATT
jgi:hypothetical protein